MVVDNLLYDLNIRKNTLNIRILKLKFNSTWKLFPLEIWFENYKKTNNKLLINQK